MYDRTYEKPTLIYETGKKQYSSVTEAMENGRKKDLVRCKSDEKTGVKERIKAIIEVLDTATEEQTIYYYKDFCKNFLKTIIERAEKYGITLNNGGGRSIID